MFRVPRVDNSAPPPMALNQQQQQQQQQQPRPVSSMGSRERTYFEEQREALIGEIAMSFEHVLANINKLNRSLEAVVAVGNEFSSVEALWSQFEGVMARDPEDGKTASEGEGQAQGQGQSQGQDQNEGEAESQGQGKATENN
ncbi:DASH complex subunit Dad1-domain-containing protein [Hypoxylon sp. NC1633]|nr:DASH complex subunit Dad1-domain-containing protein [Hypoxylon sp. NC1633]